MTNVAVLRRKGLREEPLTTSLSAPPGKTHIPEPYPSTVFNRPILTQPIIAATDFSIIPKVQRQCSEKMPPCPKTWRFKTPRIRPGAGRLPEGVRRLPEKR